MNIVVSKKKYEYNIMSGFFFKKFKKYFLSFLVFFLDPFELAYFLAYLKQFMQINKILCAIISFSR
jgi:hypothetical protein